MISLNNESAMSQHVDGTNERISSAQSKIHDFMPELRCTLELCLARCCTVYRQTWAVFTALVNKLFCSVF